MSNVYVVTGGGSGIGKAVATMLPKEDTVVITGRNLDKLNKTAEKLNETGCHIVATTCDVSKREDVKKLAQYAASLGTIKKVIHCAGVSGTMANVETIVRINALGTVYVNQEFYKVMTDGVICDIASNSGYILPNLLLPSKKTYALALSDEAEFIKKMAKRAKIMHKEDVDVQFAYMMSKNFVRWYSSQCAFKYMTNKKIRVFSISPGFVKTPMTVKEEGEGTENLLTYTALHRGAEAEEIAFLITSLADERCGYFIGADVLVDGGCVNNGYAMTTAAKKYDNKSLNEKW